jgi:hypothetical protein
MKYKYYIYSRHHSGYGYCWICRVDSKAKNLFDHSIEFLMLNGSGWSKRDNNPNYIPRNITFNSRRNLIRVFKKVEGNGHKLIPY